jgi:WD40 repeat protein
VLRGHEEAVLEVEMSADGSRVVSSSADRSVRVWDLAGDRSLILRGHQGTTYADFGSDGSRIVSTADDGTRVWDAVTGAPILEIPSPDREAYRAALSGDGTKIALQTFDGRILLLSCEVCGSIDSVRTLAARRTTRDLTDAERQAFSIGGGA